MIKKLTTTIVLLACLQIICSSQVFDAFSSDDNELAERDLEDLEMERREASEFLMKRLFHPFSTKNEEIKRETREVYEEKCESIVPTQRFCPDLKTW